MGCTMEITDLQSGKMLSGCIRSGAFLNRETGATPTTSTPPPPAPIFRASSLIMPDVSFSFFMPWPPFGWTPP